MAEVLLFHHANGLTPGCLSFAQALRNGGHVVHTPDLYEGKTFADLTAGVAHAEETGFGTIVERGRFAAERLSRELVYAGISLGALPAQALAQTRPGAKGAVLISAAISPSEFGGAWPEDVPLRIHMMEGDAWVEEDLTVARELAGTLDGAELFLYEGDRHLFVDDGLPDYDAGASAKLLQRVLAFLDGLG